MNLKQLWSIIRGRRTNFSWMNASWTYYPDGDPVGKHIEPTAAKPTLAEFPRLFRAIEFLGLDNGGNPVGTAIIPEVWETRARIAEDELLQLTPSEMEDLVYGEEGDQQIVAKRAPAANGFIDATFDGGELSELLMEPWRKIYDARDAERRAALQKDKEPFPDPPDDSEITA